MASSPESLPPARSSALTLPPGHWPTLLDGLCARFPAVSRERWSDRFLRGLVLDALQQPLPLDAPYRVGARVFYFREVPQETPIPFTETVLYRDDHLLVADKPHFLPVMPAGRFVEETLLRRLIRRFDNPDLVPLHRIDRHTAGLVLFSVNRDSRAAYQALFREQKIKKYYEAIAPALAQHNFPLRRTTRLDAGEPFFRMQEVGGAANSETLIEVRARRDPLWRYALSPVTGKKHQLRVHMAALGAAICDDPIYPELREEAADDYSQPMRLLAQRLTFVDPLSGVERRFESRLTLHW